MVLMPSLLMLLRSCKSHKMSTRRTFQPVSRHLKRFCQLKCHGRGSVRCLWRSCSSALQACFPTTVQTEEEGWPLSQSQLLMSLWRGAYTFSALAENDDIPEKKTKKPLADTFNRLSPFEKAWVDQSWRTRLRAAVCSSSMQNEPQKQPQQNPPRN